MLVTCNSTACPAPCEAIKVPLNETQAAVVIRLRRASSNFSKSTTACKEARQEPSLI